MAVKKGTIIAIIIGIVVLVAVAIGVVIAIGGNGNSNENSAVLPLNNSQNANNGNVNGNESNTNEPPDILSTTKEVTLTGSVFLKGYKTPSESYGITTSDNYEVGLGKYDSMKEQFRSYIGDQVKVTFSSICRSSIGNCCRTLFHYCGTVKSWEPVTKQ